jgi:ATP-dependent Clp protease adapter protein ClpS
MERNQAASKALLNQLDSSQILDIAEFEQVLWRRIYASVNHTHALSVLNDDTLSFDFIIRLFVKIGFNCEDAVRLMMGVHRYGRIVLAKSDYETLADLKTYIDQQAKNHRLSVAIEILPLYPDKPKQGN